MAFLGERIVEVSVEEEMKTSYLEYAMSVIVGRALPDARDGLKPVQRRILYAMHELGLTHEKPHKKSARIVGEVLGKYHPHGDAAVYDAMVRLAQDFTLRYPLIEGQGNFGSIDGDAPAAMRYTEARLSQIAEEMLADLEKDTVSWRSNFDNTLKEPEVLPAKFPNLLVNGSSGIAVGMATNIPPHNLSEVVDGIIKVIDNPDVSVEELMEVIKGPDFPTGGIIVGTEGIKSAYKTGRGSIRIRAKVEIERSGHRERIVIREIPYQVNKSRLLEEIAEFLKSSSTQSISSLRDESDRRGMRIVLDLKPHASAEIVLNNLFKHTPLETTFGIINLALIDGEPRILSLKDMIECYLRHRKDVVRRRLEYELRQAESEKHILEGFLTAISHIDDVISLVKSAKDAESAVNALINRFGLSEKQASAILKMRISRLSTAERERIAAKSEELAARIEHLRGVLASERRILEIIREELLDLKRRFGDARRTEIVEEAPQKLSERDFIEDIEVLLIFTDKGVKRLPLIFKRQSRGGKGTSVLKDGHAERILRVVSATTRQKLLIFTSKGRAFQAFAYEIPERSRNSAVQRLPSIPSLSSLAADEVSAVLPIPEEVERCEEEYAVVFATKRGIVKQMPLSELRAIRSTGVVAVKIADGDALADVALLRRMSDAAAKKEEEGEWQWRSSKEQVRAKEDEEQCIFLATKKGKAILFNAAEIREMGKYAAGVRGMQLAPDDEVVAVEVVATGASLRRRSRRKREQYILTVTERGFGKRTPVSAYRETHRGGKGILNFRVSEKTGDVVGVKAVREEDVFIASEAGMLIRISARNIPSQGRNTQGVKLLSLNNADKIAAVEVNYSTD